jgi:hypothetical protein
MWTQMHASRAVSCLAWQKWVRAEVRAALMRVSGARAKTMLTRQYVQQSETVSGQAGALGFYDMISTYQFAITYLNQIHRSQPMT